MQTAISKLTVIELNDMIERIVDKKLSDILNDDDLGLRLKESVVIRLREQDKNIKQGKYGRKLSDIISESGIQ